MPAAHLQHAHCLRALPREQERHRRVFHGGRRRSSTGLGYRGRLC